MFGIKGCSGGFARVGASSAHTQAQQLWFAPVVHLSVFICVHLWLLFGMGCSDRDISSVSIKNAWVRQNIPPQTMTAAYLAIHNRGAATALVSASTPAAEVAEIHVMTTDGNIMRMKKIDRLPIPEDGSATLQPGGNHLMLIGLRRDLAPGDSLALTLTFANGQVQTLRAPVVSFRNEGRR